MSNKQQSNEGWVQTLKLNGRTIVLNGKDPLGWIVYYPDEVMTGQEWYEKFRIEFRKLAPKSYAKDFYAKKAAQIAAGIKDD